MRQWRESKGITTTALAEKLGHALDDRVKNWENGKDIPGLDLIKIINALEFGNNELQTLTFARFPVLDPKILEKSSEDKRASLLIKAYRERKGMTLEQFASAINSTDTYNVSTICRWENGQTKISLSIVSFKTALDLTGEESNRLELQIKKSNDSIKNRGPIKRAKSTSVGVILEPDHPVNKALLAELNAIAEGLDKIAANNKTLQPHLEPLSARLKKVIEQLNAPGDPTPHH